MGDDISLPSAGEKAQVAIAEDVIDSALKHFRVSCSLAFQSCVLERLLRTDRKISCRLLAII